MSYIVEYDNGDTLCHYGVLGMRWGQRRYQNADGSLTPAGKARYVDSSGHSYDSYKSHGQRKWDKKLEKAKASGNESAIKKAQRKKDIYTERDEMRKEYASSTSKGKSIARSMVLGPFFNGSYSRLRSAGISKGLSAVVAMLDVSMIGGLGSYITEKDMAEYRLKQRNRM